jgi:hypothetical protein
VQLGLVWKAFSFDIPPEHHQEFILKTVRPLVEKLESSGLIVGYNFNQYSAPNDVCAVDFLEPIPALHREDGRELRAKILAPSPSQARLLGIEKSTLHYLRRNASRAQSFRIYRSVNSKLQQPAEGRRIAGRIS